jgi:hypothetical protein
MGNTLGDAPHSLGPGWGGCHKLRCQLCGTPHGLIINSVHTLAEGGGLACNEQHDSQEYSDALICRFASQGACKGVTRVSVVRVIVWSPSMGQPRTPVHRTLPASSSAAACLMLKGKDKGPTPWTVSTSLPGYQRFTAEVANLPGACTFCRATDSLSCHVPGSGSGFSQETSVELQVEWHGQAHANPLIR